jgi:hypothetical protein
LGALKCFLKGKKDFKKVAVQAISTKESSKQGKAHTNPKRQHSKKKKEKHYFSSRIGKITSQRK